MRKSTTLVLAVALTVSVLFAAVAVAAQAKTSKTPTPAPAPAAEHPAKKLAPQATCPVTNEGINKEIYTDYEGKRIYFCCPMCKDTFAKDPANYLKALADKGEEPQAAPQEGAVKTDASTSMECPMPMGGK